MTSEKITRPVIARVSGNIKKQEKALWYSHSLVTRQTNHHMTDTMAVLTLMSNRIFLSLKIPANSSLTRLFSKQGNTQIRVKTTAHKISDCQTTEPAGSHTRGSFRIT